MPNQNYLQLLFVSSFFFFSSDFDLSDSSLAGFGIFSRDFFWPPSFKLSVELYKPSFEAAVSLSILKSSLERGRRRTGSITDTKRNADERCWVDFLPIIVLKVDLRDFEIFESTSGLSALLLLEWLGCWNDGGLKTIGRTAVTFVILKCCFLLFGEGMGACSWELTALTKMRSKIIKLIKSVIKPSLIRNNHSETTRLLLMQSHFLALYFISQIWRLEPKNIPSYKFSQNSSRPLYFL